MPTLRRLADGDVLPQAPAPSGGPNPPPTSSPPLPQHNVSAVVGAPPVAAAAANGPACTTANDGGGALVSVDRRPNAAGFSLSTSSSTVLVGPAAHRAAAGALVLADASTSRVKNATAHAEELNPVAEATGPRGKGRSPPYDAVLLKRAADVDGAHPFPVVHPPDACDPALGVSAGGVWEGRIPLGAVSPNRRAALAQNVRMEEGRRQEQAAGPRCLAGRRGECENGRAGELAGRRGTYPLEVITSAARGVGGWGRRLTLRHTGLTNQHLAFKVKTNRPRRYLARPNHGIVAPGSSVTVSILLVDKALRDTWSTNARLGQLTLDRSRDKFMFQSCAVSDEFSSQFRNEPRSDEGRYEKKELTELLTGIWHGGSVPIFAKELLVRHNALEAIATGEASSNDMVLDNSTGGESDMDEDDPVDSDDEEVVEGPGLQDLPEDVWMAVVSYSQPVDAYHLSISSICKSADAITNIGDNLMRDNKSIQAHNAYTEAIRVLRRASLRQKPRDYSLRASQILSSRAISLIKLELYEEALADAGMAVAYDYTSGEARVRQAQALFFLERHQEALEAYKEASENIASGTTLADVVAQGVLQANEARIAVGMDALMEKTISARTGRDDACNSSCNATDTTGGETGATSNGGELLVLTSGETMGTALHNSAASISTDAPVLEGNDSNGTTSTDADVFDADAPIFRSATEMKDVCGDEMEALNELNRQHSQAMDVLLRAKTRSQKSPAVDAGEDLLPQIVATQRSLVEKVAAHEGLTDLAFLQRDGQIDLHHPYSKRVFEQVLSKWPKGKKRPSDATSSNQHQSKQKQQAGRKKAPATGSRRSKRARGNEGATIDLEKENSRAVDAPKKSRRRTRKTPSVNYKEGDSDAKDEEESSGAESDYEDASTKRRAQPKKRSKSKPKAAKRKRLANSNESEAEAHEETPKKGRGRQAPKKRKNREVTDAKYDTLKRELANTCRKHQKDGKWKGEPSYKCPDGLRKYCPTELRTSLLNALLEEHNLTDMSKGWKDTLWDNAATIARDGKKVKGDGAGDVSWKYKHTKSAETNAKQCSENGTAALYDEFDGGKDAALRFVEESKQSECKRAELEEKLSKLQGTRKKRRKKKSAAERTKEATERAELAVKALDSMKDVQSEDEATAEVLDAMENAHVRIEDAGEMCKTDARDMIPAYEENLRSNPLFADLEAEARENGVRMVKSQICHHQVSVRMLVKLKRKGLAHIHVMTDENGQPYKAIFVAAPKWLILHYCQGAAKKYNGGAGNTKNRAPVDTGGHLQVDILNGGLTINTNAFNGEHGHLDNETKRIFQVLSVDKRRKGSIDAYYVDTPQSCGCTHTTLQLHQLVLGTAFFYGMNANLECHTRDGGILAGVVGAGETVEKQFRCNVTCPNGNTTPDSSEKRI